jgi:hypothetical protein
LQPPQPVTGYSHPRCYLSATGDCSKKISREHYISRTILQEFPRILVSGLRWQKLGEVLEPGIDAMTVKILCSRHNSALSPLDALALRAFRAFIDAPYYVAFRRNPGKAAHYLVSGDALELWMIKLMCGIYFGGVGSADGAAVRDTYKIDMASIIAALTTGHVMPGAGLYVTQGPGQMAKKSVSVAPMNDTAKNETVGVSVGFGTLSFETLIVPPPDIAFRRMIKARRYRPGVIDFTGVSRDARVAITWRNQGNEINRLALEIAPG